LLSSHTSNLIFEKVFPVNQQYQDFQLQIKPVYGRDKDRKIKDSFTNCLQVIRLFLTKAPIGKTTG
jgi:hypothetical protein